MPAFWGAGSTSHALSRLHSPFCEPAPACTPHSTVPPEWATAQEEKGLLLRSLSRIALFHGRDKLHPLMQVSWHNLVRETGNPRPSCPDQSQSPGVGPRNLLCLTRAVFRSGTAEIARASVGRRSHALSGRSLCHCLLLPSRGGHRSFWLSRIYSPASALITCARLQTCQLFAICSSHPEAGSTALSSHLEVTPVSAQDRAQETLQLPPWPPQPRGCHVTQKPHPAD